MRVLIIEDEAPAARRLISLIRETENSAEILAVLDSIEASVNWFSSNKQPDLLFLDINLADGNSFLLFEKCSVTCPVIFSTAYDDYAIKAFKVNSIDYLLKPVIKEELQAAISKFRNMKIAHDGSALEKLISGLSQKNKDYKQRFLVKIGDRLIPVHVNDICYFSSEDKAVRINCINNSYLIDYTLDQLEELLDPRLFFRISRKIISQSGSITKIYNHLNGRLKIMLHPTWKEEVFVSRERAAEFKIWLEKAAG